MEALGFDGFIAEIDGAKTLQEIRAVMARIAMHLGFELFSYQLIVPPEGPRFPLFATNFPEEWTQRYFEARHISHDLVTRVSAIETRPFLWSRIPNVAKATPRQRTVFNEASEFKLKYGGTIPINGPGLAKALFAVSNRNISEEQFAKLFMEKRHALQLIGGYIHERILGVGMQSPPPSAKIKLTPREIEILTYTADGKSAWDISVILSLSESTVNEHINNTCRKMGVHSKMRAISILLVNGIITI